VEFNEVSGDNSFFVVACWSLNGLKIRRVKRRTRKELLRAIKKNAVEISFSL
jgi:hypothetical protein